MTARQRTVWWPMSAVGGRSGRRRRKGLGRRPRATTLRRAGGPPSLSAVRKVVTAVAIAAVVAAMVLAAIRRQESAAADVVAMNILYTAPTANDAAASLDQSIEQRLRLVSEAHESIRLIRVDGDGSVSARVIDMTPRVGDNPDSDVIKVPQRVRKATDTKISSIQSEISGQDASSPGRSLFGGLTKAGLDPSVPLVVVSQGLDTEDPVDFRKLGFDMPVDELSKQLKFSGELPDLVGVDVTFQLVATAGRQKQLRPPQMTYRDHLWESLLRIAGATSVRFVASPGGISESDQVAPPIPIPSPPDTPIKPEPDPISPQRSTCLISSSTYFEPDRAVLIDRQATLQALKRCAKQVHPQTTISIEGHTASTGRPNNRAAIALSRDRAQVIADLLANLGAPRRQITSIRGYGNANTPYPDPSDSRNRCVVVTFTT